MNTELLTDQGLIYIAGYVAARFKYKDDSLGDYTINLPTTDAFSWVQYLSDGYLIQPTDAFVEVAQIMEDTFQAFHGKRSFNKTDGIFKKVTALVREEVRLRQVNCRDCEVSNVMCSLCDKMIKVPEDAILCLVKTRTNIRKRVINEKISELYAKKKNAQKNKKFLPPK